MLPKNIILVTLILSAFKTTTFAMSSSHARPDPSVVVSVDLKRYSGLWYEIAKTPNFFQRNCLRSTAEYQVIDAKSLSVHNICYRENNKITDIEGIATVLRPEMPSKLKVQFKIFLINPTGDYWISELDPDYQWAVVSGPGMKYNFLLSRTFPMKEETKKQIFELLKLKNYPVTEFIFDLTK